jgi:hypothetical protein
VLQRYSSVELTWPAMDRQFIPYFRVSADRQGRSWKRWIERGSD